MDEYKGHQKGSDLSCGQSMCNGANQHQHTSANAGSDCKLMGFSRVHSYRFLFIDHVGLLVEVADGLNGNQSDLGDEGKGSRFQVRSYGFS